MSSGGVVGAHMLVLQHCVCCAQISIADYFQKCIAQRALLVAHVAHTHWFHVSQREHGPAQKKQRRNVSVAPSRRHPQEQTLRQIATKWMRKHCQARDHSHWRDADRDLELQ